MNEIDPVIRNDLGDVVASADLGDCRLEFRFQRPSGDLWCVTSGPLATMAHPLLTADGVALAGRHAVNGLPGRRSHERYAKWPRVRINDDLLVAFRARGDDLQFAWLYGAGFPYGGGDGWLPTSRKATVVERMEMWLSGRRGTRVLYARHVDGDAR